MATVKHLRIAGRVQGVGFRYFMERRAGELGVTGWVRNRHDGTVEAVVHGWPDDVNAMLDWARRGPPAARVTRMDVNDASGEYETFERHPSG